MPASKILAVRRHFIPGSSILSTPYRHTDNIHTGLGDRQADRQRLGDTHRDTGRQTHRERQTDTHGQSEWWVKVLRPTRHKICYVWDVLPGQSLALVLKKLNLTQQKQTFNQNAKILQPKINTKTKARLGCLVRPPMWKRMRFYSKPL